MSSSQSSLAREGEQARFVWWVRFGSLPFMFPHLWLLPVLLMNAHLPVLWSGCFTGEKAWDETGGVPLSLSMAPNQYCIVSPCFTQKILGCAEKMIKSNDGKLDSHMLAVIWG